MSRPLHHCSVCGGRHYYGSKPYLKCQRRAAKVSLSKPKPRRKTPRTSKPSRSRSTPTTRASTGSRTRQRPGARAGTTSQDSAGLQAFSGTVVERRAARSTVVLKQQVGEHAATIVAMLQDPSTGYEAVADVLLQARPLSRRFLRRHELCAALNDLAEAIDPATYAAAIAQGVTDALVAEGVPRWVAQGLANTAFTTLMLGTGVVDPTAHLRLVLRGLILLVCPNLDRCPTQRSVCSALASPAVAQQLRFALSI